MEAWDHHYASAMDLLSPSVQTYLLGRISLGLFAVVTMRAPQGSFSIRRKPPLRTKQHPEGCP